MDTLADGIESANEKKNELKHTCVLVIQLQKVTLVVQLIGVAVEQRKDGLQLRNRVLVDLHDHGLVGLYHGHGSCAIPRRTVSAAAGRLDVVDVDAVDVDAVYWAAIVGLRRRRGRAAQRDVRERVTLLDLGF